MIEIPLLKISIYLMSVYFLLILNTYTSLLYFNINFKDC